METVKKVVYIHECTEDEKKTGYYPPLFTVGRIICPATGLHGEKLLLVKWRSSRVRLSVKHNGVEYLHSSYVEVNDTLPLETGDYDLEVNSQINILLELCVLKTVSDTIAVKKICCKYAKEAVELSRLLHDLKTERVSVRQFISSHPL